jgi:defect-in-organelle-trafficking protein DotD
MTGKLTTMIWLSLTLCACATPPPRDPPDSSGSALAEASYAVSRNLSTLTEVAQAAHPIPDMPPSASPASYGMAGLTSVDWSGPVEPLVRQIAKSVNYRTRVLGRAPAIPVMVSIYDKNMMVADILRDVGYQCGRRATVVVYPDSRVIELRYAKN